MTSRPPHIAVIGAGVAGAWRAWLPSAVSGVVRFVEDRERRGELHRWRPRMAPGSFVPDDVSGDALAARIEGAAEAEPTRRIAAGRITSTGDST